MPNKIFDVITNRSLFTLRFGKKKFKSITIFFKKESGITRYPGRGNKLAIPIVPYREFGRALVRRGSFSETAADNLACGEKRSRRPKYSWRERKM